MNSLSTNPLVPANKVLVFIVGVASAIVGIAFVVLTTWTVFHMYAEGRLGQYTVIAVIGIMATLGIGFLGIAFAMFPRKGAQRDQYLGSFVLYVVGGILFVLPVLILALQLMMEPNVELTPILKSLPLSALGLLAIRLGQIRAKKRL